ELVWIAGLAELTAPYYWPLGATGFTSGFANVSPALSIRMLDALRAGDFADAMQVWELIRPFEELRPRNDSEHNVSVVKESRAQRGLRRRDARAPVSAREEVDRRRVSEWLGAWELAAA